MFIEGAKNGIKAVLRRLPYLNYIFARNDELEVGNAKLQEELAHYMTWQPPGHFYSPIPDLAEVRAQEHRLFDRSIRTLGGIDLRRAEQESLLAKFKLYYDEQPFTSHAKPGLRYYFDNQFFSYSDAIYLHCLIRHRRPRRIIEVGSGYSSCVILDTNDLFFDRSINCTHIEPFPDSLHRLIGPDTVEMLNLRQSKLQDVPLELFDELQANDILFVDSTHVAKAGSDVNRLFFDVLPRLKPGVLIHIHDVFFPFEYRRDWLEEGRAWNEAYLLRAFLQYNRSFRILLFSAYVAITSREWLRQNMPLCLEHAGGSLWLERVR